uniref:Uncharacterized protein n=1 Tax=Amphimedon queenslandica TaxID=400682 RepID=A0A1X7U5D9_AMPQE
MIEKGRVLGGIYLTGGIAHLIRFITGFTTDMSNK